MLASARTAVSNPYPRQQGQQEVLGHESQELIEYDYQMQDFYGVLEVGKLNIDPISISSVLSLTDVFHFNVSLNRVSPPDIEVALGELHRCSS